jgi:23S rRNA (cytosine1962-C5)-methyltransferase
LARNKLPRVVVPRSTELPLRRGHPWVFGDVKVPAKVGAAVVLTTASGEAVAWGLADEGEIVVRVLGLGDPGAVDLDKLLQERIGRADALRARLIEAPTDAYRVVNGEGDGLPGLVLDRYGAVAVLRLYSKGWEQHLAAIVQAVSGLPWVRTVLRKLGVERVDGSEGVLLLAGEPSPPSVVVHEGQMRLLVQPGVGQKTGMFLDQREHRALVGRWSSGRVVANLFAYHGGFSVAAALGGARRVTTVDLAPAAIDDARENFRLNGLDPDQHGFEVADAFAWTPGERLDLLIVDPPSLARARRAAEAARNAYRKLHRRLGEYVARDGLLATSSCTSWVDETTWRGLVEEGLCSSGSWSWLHTSGAPPDHPRAAGHAEGSYLKFGLLRRR